MDILEYNELIAEVLLQIGFVDAGQWSREIGQSSRGVERLSYQSSIAEANLPLICARLALYAFVIEDRVLYIGKTTRSIKNRFVGYCNPGNTQATNRRCHDNISQAIATDQAVRIFIFVPISQLQYGPFQINLAAGLEDDLIRQFRPLWNGGNVNGTIISEETEREQAEEIKGYEIREDGPHAPLEHFSVVLGSTYYNLGVLNPGVVASEVLGPHGDPISIHLGGPEEIVLSTINRTANKNGSVRVVGNNREIAEWYRRNFNLGDTVQGEALTPHTIQLIAPTSGANSARNGRYNAVQLSTKP